jgi:hypothetical protein
MWPDMPMSAWRMPAAAQCRETAQRPNIGIGTFGHMRPLTQNGKKYGITNIAATVINRFSGAPTLKKSLNR